MKPQNQAHILTNGMEEAVAATTTTTAPATTARLTQLNAAPNKSVTF